MAVAATAAAELVRRRLRAVGRRVPRANPHAGHRAVPRRAGGVDRRREVALPHQRRADPMRGGATTGEVQVARAGGGGRVLALGAPTMIAAALPPVVGRPRGLGRLELARAIATAPQVPSDRRAVPAQAVPTGVRADPAVPGHGPPAVGRDRRRAAMTVAPAGPARAAAATIAVPAGVEPRRTARPRCGVRASGVVWLVGGQAAPRPGRPTRGEPPRPLTASRANVGRTSRPGRPRSGSTRVSCATRPRERLVGAVLAVRDARRATRIARNAVAAALVRAARPAGDRRRPRPGATTVCAARSLPIGSSASRPG